MSPELIAATLTAAALALLATGARMEAAARPTPTTEGTDDGAEALPAEDF